MSSGIYCYENLVNGKRYIGQSINLKSRIAHHESYFKLISLENTYESPLLWKAIKKYGRENFSVYVLEYVPRNLLNEKEIYYIKKLSSHSSAWGYNISWGGRDVGSFVGYKKKNSTSKYFGVYLKVRDGLSFWMCQVRAFGKQIELGHFQDESFAALCYDDYVIENNLPHRLNFSDNERSKIRNDYLLSVYRPKHKKSTSSSRFFGVRRKYVGKYTYYVSFLEKVHIGTSKSEVDAALKYNKYILDNKLNKPLNII